jgi:hypothetical protein
MAVFFSSLPERRSSHYLVLDMAGIQQAIGRSPFNSQQGQLCSSRQDTPEFCSELVPKVWFAA